jgi:hypothetical protein
MPVAPWPEWLPDQADYANPGTPMMKNVVPLTARSYGPMPTFSPYSDNTLDERCQGGYSVKDETGRVYFFAGDRTKLYQLPLGSRTLTDASRTTGGAYATHPLPSGFWQFTGFGHRVIATNGVDPIQSLLAGDLHFAPLAAAAPIAKYCATVKDFLMVASTIDPVGGPVPTRVWWSALGDPTNWPTPGSITAIQLQSDYQDLQQTDLGVVTGLVAGLGPASDIAVFCERGIWTGSFEGPPTMFRFGVSAGSSGTISPLSIVQAHARDGSGALRPVAYYLAENGFTAFDGSTCIPIGAQKFDREFFRELDHTYVGAVLGAADPRTRTILWAFSAGTGTDGMYNRLLIYNWELGRASIVELDAASHVEWFLGAMYSDGYNLEQLDQFGNLDVIQPGLDDPLWVGNASNFITVFDLQHKLGVGRGPAMAPTLETAETQPNDRQRAWVSSVRPLMEGATGCHETATVAVGHREKLTDPVVWEPPVNCNVIGECPQRVTGRYLRFRLAMPALQEFRHLQGLDVELRAEARLR